MSSSPTRNPADFSTRAATYDELRPVDAWFLAVADRVAELGAVAGRRVLDVGCGTGRLALVLVERHSAKVWGVDPSEEMLAVARAKSTAVGWKRGTAERLPFKDGWFDAAAMNLVVHHLDRPRAFAELHRVVRSGGRVVVASVDPAGLAEHWIARVSPRYVAIERERFPDAGTLRAELDAAGFRDVGAETIAFDRSLTRDEALDKARRRAWSTFDLLNDAEIDETLERIAALPDRIDDRVVRLLVAGTRP